jgi:excisionase family DNA binding protein
MIDMKKINPQNLITKSEMARVLKVSPTTIQNMINRGELRKVKIKGAELVILNDK